MRKRGSALGRTLGVAAALSLALFGLTTAVAPTQASAATTFQYVNMGDSLSAGEGTYTYGDGSTNKPGTNMCHRSPDAYSAKFAASSITSYALKNVACSGATTRELTGSFNPNASGIYDAGEAPQVQALSSATRLVTISIGINDLGLVGFAANCYLVHSSDATFKEEDACFTGIPQRSDYKNNLAALPGKLATAYNAIRSHAPNALVAVLTYPQVYPTTFTGFCETFPNGLLSQAVLVTSQAMLNTARSVVHQLNSTIKTEVAKHANFIVVDEENALAGHDMCASTPWANHVNVSLVNQAAEPESLHPNISGYGAIANLLRYRLDAGHFSNGSSDSGITSAYLAAGGLGNLGYPADNGGGPYVHYWSGPGANVQDLAGGAFGPAILVDGPKGTFFVNYGFRDAYIGGGYSSACKAPIDNAYSSGGGTRQDFVACYMTWTSASGVVVHTGCTDYGGTTMTGPNACVGFSTTSVWFSGGGVGLFGQEIWTYANGTVKDSTATYVLHGLSTTRASTLQAYIPNAHSNATHAHYHYCGTNQGCADGYVNQESYTNAWANFGAVCTTDGNATIVLADDGGDQYPLQVGADAIRATVTGIVC